MPGALAAAASATLIASYFATVLYVTTQTASCIDLAGPAHSAQCVKTGADQHSIAYLLLGLAVLALGLVLVGWRVSLTAWGIAAIGVAAILIALVADLPQKGRTGVLATDFSAGTVHAGAGLWLEVVGGVLALLAAATAVRASRGEVSGVL